MTARSVRGILLALLIATAATSLGSCGDQGKEKEPGSTAAAKYYCPMHPTYTSDRPGTCPICNMDLVPVTAEPDASEAAGGATHARVTISPQKQQLIGVRLAIVESGPLRKTIRTVGTVDYDETRLHHVHTKVEGWIGTLYASTTGQWVQAGQPLFSVYSPELVATQQEYLLALQAARAAGEDSTTATAGSLAASVRKRLELWDIDPEQLEAIADKAQALTYLDMVSHATGVVVEKNVLEGMRIMPGEELYKLADLSHVWVNVAVYEYELPLVKPGQSAALTLAYTPGDTLHGRVAYVYPYLEASTRTGQLRLEFANPGSALKPGMYANVEIAVDVGEGLSVPRDAVLDSGERQIVFVALGEGAFEPRTVQVGLQLGDRLQIRMGLHAGERVVSGAQFLIDSESQLRAALQGLDAGAPSHDTGGQAQGAASQHQH